MLGLRTDRVVSVDQLIDAVWGESPPSTARAQIQGCISGLRKLFGDAGLPEAIKTRSSGYVLSLSADELDSEKFTQLVESARTQTEAGKPAEAAARLRTALDLWRGPALDGIQSDLVRQAAALLDDARTAAIEERVRLDLELGRHKEIVGELRALVAEHPLRERLYGFLMTALYRSGRQAESLDVFRRARATLIEELGIEPCQELRDLERAVLSRDKGLDLPSAAKPAAEPADRPPVSPKQLPNTIADFIGRERHIAQIKQILSAQRQAAVASYAVPIVAIFGQGGVGKSTLALRVAHELGEEFPDGHLYVDLSGAAGDDRTSALLARFLRALGVNGSLIPDDEAERAEIYRSRLASKRLLLVLDDVRGEQQVLPLLPGSPSCAVILTSRTRLSSLPGAHWIDIGAFDGATSRELLRKIVGPERVEAEPAAIDELINYCGGLPLALRIAGARLASRPHWRVGELNRRLKDEVRRLDEFSHHGLELRSSIGSTYRGLPESAKRLFRLIGLIQAPDVPAWTAAALLDSNLVDAEDILERLVEAQVLETLHGDSQTDPVRYRFHDLIRVYAQERLMETETAAEREAALSRVLGAWLALAELAHRKEYGGDYTILHGSAPRWLLPEWADDDIVGNPVEWLENERAALVAAIRQAASAGLHELCWDLALTSVSLFEVKGYLDDWRETAELALDVTAKAGNRVGYGAMLYSLGTLHIFQKRLSETERFFDAALEVFEAENNVHGQALVLRNSAHADRLRGDFERMNAKYTDALAKMRAVHDVIGEANILRSLAMFRIDEGDVDEAREMLTRALELCKSVGYLRGEAQVVSRFADLYLSTGQVLLARRALHRVLRTVREIGDRMGEAHALYGLGIVRRREGRLDSAEATLVHALAVAQRVGDRLIEGQTHYALGEIGMARGDTAMAIEHLAPAREIFGELGSSLLHAKTLSLLSEGYETTDELAMARQCVDEAIDLLSTVDSKEAVRLLSQLREAHAALIADDIVGGGRLSEAP
jgi:DNA-binding SARP family transcriptional activator